MHIVTRLKFTIETRLQSMLLGRRIIPNFFNSLFSGQKIAELTDYLLSILHWVASDRCHRQGPIKFTWSLSRIQASPTVEWLVCRPVTTTLNPQWHTLYSDTLESIPKVRPALCLVQRDRDGYFLCEPTPKHTVRNNWFQSCVHLCSYDKS